MRISFYTSYYIKNTIFLLTDGWCFFVDISTKKNQTESGFALFIAVMDFRKIKGFYQPYPP